MARIVNPFQPAPGATPPALVGRGSEVSAIHDALERAANGGRPTPLAFFGLRGLGKTVLLHRIVAESVRAVHLEIEVEPGVSLAASFREAIDLVRERDKPLRSRLGDAFEAVMRHVPIPSYELPGELGSITLGREPEAEPLEAPLGRALAMFHRAVGDAGKFLVITIDEVQDADLASLRTVVARVNQSVAAPRPVVFACAGLPQARITLRALRTYTTRWDQFDLRFLTRAESVEAIRSPLAEMRVAIDDRALDVLVEECAGYPYFVQRFASAAWNEHRGSTITEADVATIVPDVRSAIERTFYGDAFAALTVRETALALALADLGPGPHALKKIAERLDVRSDALGSVRTNLLRKELVFVPMPGTLQFRMPLADRYAREHRAELETPEVAAYRF